MVNKTEYLRDLRRELLNFKGDILRTFYYLEGQELQYKPSRKKWSILEVFEHVNIINYYYIKRLGKALDQAPKTERDTFQSGWMGSLFIKYMKPDEEGNIPFKIPTFRKTNPIHRKHHGYALVDHIVFQDFIDGVDQLIALLEKAEEKELDIIKIPTLLPFLKINIGDAFAFVVAHIERHMAQAKKAIDN